MMFSHPDNTEPAEWNYVTEPGICPNPTVIPKGKYVEWCFVNEPGMAALHEPPKKPEPLELKVYDEGGLPKWVDYVLVGVIVALFVGSGLIHLLKP